MLQVLSTVPGDVSEVDGHDLMSGAAQACTLTYECHCSWYDECNLTL